MDHLVWEHFLVTVGEVTQQTWDGQTVRQWPAGSLFEELVFAGYPLAHNPDAPDEFCPAPEWFEFSVDPTTGKVIVFAELDASAPYDLTENGDVVRAWRDAHVPG